MIALVRGVMRSSIFEMSMRKCSSTSTNTGTPPAVVTASAVLIQLMAGTITSSPG
jgi:hypothetical protein